MGKKVLVSVRRLGCYRSKITFLILTVMVFLFIGAELRTTGSTNSEYCGFSLSWVNWCCVHKGWHYNEDLYYVIDSQGSCFPHCINYLVLSKIIFLAVLGWLWQWQLEERNAFLIHPHKDLAFWAGKSYWTHFQSRPLPSILWAT